MYNNSERSVVEMAASFEILSHPVRIEIFKLPGMTKKKGMSALEIQESLGLCKPEVSWHLWALKTGLILIAGEGSASDRYHLNTSNQLVSRLNSLFKKKLRNNA
jgi:hypothetical protein